MRTSMRISFCRCPAFASLTCTLPTLEMLNGEDHWLLTPGKQRQSCWPALWRSDRRGRRSPGFNVVMSEEPAPGSRIWMSSLSLFLTMKRGATVTTLVRLYYLIISLFKRGRTKYGSAYLALAFFHSNSSMRFRATRLRWQADTVRTPNSIKTLRLAPLRVSDLQQCSILTIVRRK